MMHCLQSFSYCKNYTSHQHGIQCSMDCITCHPVRPAPGKTTEMKDDDGKVVGVYEVNDSIITMNLAPLYRIKLSVNYKPEEN